MTKDRQELVELIRLLGHIKERGSALVPKALPLVDQESLCAKIDNSCEDVRIALEEVKEHYAD